MGLRRADRIQLVFGSGQGQSTQTFLLARDKGARGGGPITARGCREFSPWPAAVVERQAAMLISQAFVGLSPTTAPVRR